MKEIIILTQNCQTMFLRKVKNDIILLIEYIYKFEYIKYFY